MSEGKLLAVRVIFMDGEVSTTEHVEDCDMDDGVLVVKEVGGAYRVYNWPHVRMIKVTEMAS
jgi:hypothetical protein